NANRYRASRGITSFENKPEEYEVIAGAWWPRERQEAFVAVRDDAAETLDISVGDELEWIIGTETVSAKVAAIVRIESIRMGSNAYFTLTPETLEGRPAVYFGGVRIAPDKAPE